MGLRINQNIMAFSAYRNLTVTDRPAREEVEKLSAVSASTERPTTLPDSSSARAFVRR